MAGVLRVWFGRELVHRRRQAEEAGIQRSGGGDPATRSSARGGQQGEPQAALGAEALLRGEVETSVAATSTAGAAGGGGAVDHHQGVVAAPGTRRTGAMAPVEVSLWAQAYEVGVLDRGSGTATDPGSARDHRSARQVRSRGRGSGELGRELPEARVRAPAPIREKTAMSQNKVEPPLPSTTS